MEDGEAIAGYAAIFHAPNAVIISLYNQVCERLRKMSVQYLPLEAGMKQRQ